MCCFSGWAENPIKCGQNEGGKREGEGEKDRTQEGGGGGRDHLQENPNHPDHGIHTVG